MHNIIFINNYTFNNSLNRIMQYLLFNNVLLQEKCLFPKIGVAYICSKYK